MLLKLLKSLIKKQRGEIATVLTLISVSLMLMGVVVGNVAVQQTTRTQPKASTIDDTIPTEPPPAAPAAGEEGDICGAPGVPSCKKPLVCCDIQGSDSFRAGTCKKTCAAPPPAAPLKKQGDRCGSDEAPGTCQTSCKSAVPGSLECEGTLCCESVGAAPSPTATTAPVSCHLCNMLDSTCYQTLSDQSGKCPDVYIPGTCNLDPCNFGTTPVMVPTSTPTSKTLCDTCHVVCSQAKMENGNVCESGTKGEKTFCYNECNPGRPGYSSPVYCSGGKGFEIGPVQRDPACGEATGAVPTPGASCENNKYQHGETIATCREVACDGIRWVSIDKVCLDGQIVNKPGGVLKNDCADPAPLCDGKLVPTQPLINPTKPAKPGGFHIGSEIYTINRDKGVEFQFNIKFYFDGCDGDIKLEQNGNTVAGVNGWKGPGDYTYSPAWTNSPVLGNGQLENITYTGRLVNYHCLGGKNPDNLTDSIRCRLAVDDKGNPRASGTGCTWMNQDDIKPVVRATITPGPTSSQTSGGTGSCYPFECPTDSNKQFSVKNKQLYNSGNCSGTPIDSYSKVCGNSKSGCEFVGGICKNDKADCDPKKLGSGYTGKAYDRWGPVKDGLQNVNILLCSDSNEVCCEPSTGPNGGFNPKPLPTIAVAPSTGTKSTGNADDDCKFTLPPDEVAPKTPFDMDVYTGKFNLAASIKLDIKDGTNLIATKEPVETWFDDKTQTRPVLPATYSYVRWKFKGISIDNVGNYTLSLRFDNSGANAPDNSITSCITKPTITVQAASSSTPTPTGTAPRCSGAVDSILPACTSCIKGKIGTATLKTITDCTTDNQKINKYCTKNMLTSFAQCSEFIAQCASDCATSVNSVGNFLVPQSYDNESFNAVVEARKLDRINAITASLYVLNATRVPGLQRLYCDPFKGQCDFYYQQQMGT